MAKVVPSVKDGQLVRRNGIYTITVMADVRRDVNVTALTSVIKEKVATIPLPDKVTLAYGGDDEQDNENLPPIMVYHNFLPEDQRFWVGFATVTVPLTGWWGGSHAIKKEKLQVKNTENQLADQGELLVIRMKNAWNGVNEAYEQMKIARLSIEQSTENLRLNTDYYKAGTCTMSDLLDAQTLFQQSCDKYVESYTDYELKKREYLQVTGRR